MRITITLTGQDAVDVAEYSKRIGLKPENWARTTILGRVRYFLEKLRLDEADERAKYRSPALKP